MYPVLSSDHAHIKGTDSADLLSTHRIAEIFHPCPVHLPAVHTEARLRQGPYAVFLTRSKEQVKNYICKCSVCLFVAVRPARIGFGSPRYIKFMQDGNIAWKCSSADQIGPFRASAWPGSKKSIQYHKMFARVFLASCICKTLCSMCARLLST